MSTEYTLAQVAEHTTNTDCWMVIDNKVLNVTEFLKEHPGGAEVMVEVAGQDATQSFKDVGHSADAWEMLDDYQVGSIKGGESKGREKPKTSNEGSSILKSLKDNADLIVSFGVLAGGLFMLYRARKK